VAPGYFDDLGGGNLWLQRKHSALGGRWQPLGEFKKPERESWWRILLVWWSYDGLLGTSAVISEGYDNYGGRLCWVGRIADIVPALCITLFSFTMYIFGCVA
jgi:hypothetical protein